MKKKLLTGVLLPVLMLCGCTKKLVDMKTESAYNKTESGAAFRTAAFTDFGDFDYKGVNWVPYGDNWLGSTLNSDADDLKNAGTKWVRVWFRSDRSLASLDSLVNKCIRSGASILAVYKKSFPKNDLGTPAEQTKDQARLDSMVRRYKANIHYWEIHNEPNINDTAFWLLGPKITPDTTIGSAYSNGVKNYVSWLQLAYNTIKGADATAKVIMGGLSSYQFDPFVTVLTREHAYNFCDEVAFHPYAATPDKVVGVLNTYKKKIKSWASTDIPIWITEIGFYVGVNGSGIAGVNDEAEKAADLQAVYEKLTQNLYVKRPIFWYSLHKDVFNGNDFNLTMKASSTAATTYFPAYTTFKNNTHSWSYLQGVGTTIVQQTEYLAIENNTDGFINFYDDSASNDNGIKLNSNAVDDSITFVVPNVPAGTYNIRVRVKKSNTRGTFQLYAYKTGQYSSGSNVGGVQDTYSATDVYTELNIANWTVGSESDKSFRFKVKGKNAASSDYTLAFDYIKLIPQ